MTPKALAQLVQSLSGLPDESGWVEFKLNNEDPQKIGENISALSNSAALCKEMSGYEE